MNLFKLLRLKPCEHTESVLSGLSQWIDPDTQEIMAREIYSCRACWAHIYGGAPKPLRMFL